METACLATRYAEFHLESTREMLRAYDRTSVERDYAAFLGIARNRA